ncbi:MAG: putative methyltransferase, partial [Mucilaginibacter sp.]|nr:putative methyltransferase [Mucilaginibacter sp.]
MMQKLNMNKEVMVPLFFGERMKVVSGETVSSGLIAFGYTEVALTALMLNEITEGKSVIDIGAHYGYEAMLAAKLVGNSGTVVSFEPNPYSYSLALKNLSGKNCKLYNYAVGSYNGLAKMNNNNVANSAFNSVVNDDLADRIIEVPMVTLDSILKDRPKAVDFIKCDVEGFEIEVIKGAL